jgi:hypothetical protein
MPVTLDILLAGVAMGVAGSALMDVWSAVLRRRFGISTLDYRLLGRWIGHMAAGRFAHDRIAASAPIRAERWIGWIAHYAIGVAFALVLLAIWGRAWLAAPTVWPALLVGLGTIVAPWFVMQPAMGAGVAGSRSPNPRATRLRNLGTHTVYGIGLYAAALAMSLGRILAGSP